MQTPVHVRKNVCRLLPLLAAISLVDVIRQSRGSQELTLPLWIGWIVSIGAIVLALFVHTIQRVITDCTCSFGGHVVQAYNCLLLGLTLLANLMITVLLARRETVPAFGFLGWCTYALIWLAFLSVSELRLWREAGYFETESEGMVA